MTSLGEGFESPFGLELLSTAHWVLEIDRPESIDDIVATVHAWKIQNKRFSPRQLGLVADGLAEKRWLTHRANLSAWPPLTSPHPASVWHGFVKDLIQETREKVAEAFPEPQVGSPQPQPPAP